MFNKHAACSNVDCLLTSVYLEIRHVAMCVFTFTKDLSYFHISQFINLLIGQGYEN